MECKVSDFARYWSIRRGAAHVAELALPGKFGKLAFVISPA